MRRDTLLVGALALTLAIALTWPLALHLGDRTIGGPYVGGMLWSLRAVMESPIEAHHTRLVGWPVSREARFLGWSFLGPAIALRGLGPVVVANLVAIAAAPLSAVSMHALIRRWLPGGAPLTMALAALVYAFAPHHIANLSAMELAKAWAWVVPATLFLALKTQDHPAWGLALAPMSLVLAFTEPYACVVGAAAAPFLLDHRRWKSALLALALIAGGALAARAYFDTGLLPMESVFRPAQAAQLATEKLAYPWSSAPLTALLGRAQPPLPSGIQHIAAPGIFLVGAASWGLAAAARAGERERVLRLGLLGLVGLLSALGPLLFLVPDQAPLVALPMMVAEKFQLLPAKMGMYYRFIHLTILALCLAAAQAPLRWPGAVGLGLGAALELRWLLLAGLPLPTAPLPWPDLAAEIAADPVPGAVMDLPAYPEGESVKAKIMAFTALHGRPSTALPRRPAAPMEAPPYSVALDDCAAGGPCRAPEGMRQGLEAVGIRWVILDPSACKTPEPLRRLLEDRLGPAREVDGVYTWTLDAAPPERVSDRPKENRRSTSEPQRGQPPPR